MFRLPQPNAISWMVYKPWKFIPQRSGDWKSDQDSSMVRSDKSSGCRLWTLCRVFTWQEESELALWCPFDEGTNRIHESSTLII